MDTITPFQHKISGKVRLPSLVKNMPVLMQALANDDLNYRQLAEVIRHYPEVSARLLFLTNSPWSAPISPISSIEQACSRLGSSIVKSLSIAISIASSFDTSKCPGFSAEHFWTTSMLVAEGSGLLASQLHTKCKSDEFKNTAQTAGLLHNLGLLWLADSLPKETGKVFQSVKQDPSLSISKTLQHYTGTDYREVGGWISNQMKLPEVLYVAMKYHHSDNYNKASWETAFLVGISAQMVSALFNQFNEVPANTRLKSLGLDRSTQTLVFQQLSKNFKKTQELAKTLF